MPQWNKYLRKLLRRTKKADYLRRHTYSSLFYHLLSGALPHVKRRTKTPGNWDTRLVTVGEWSD